jgi:phage terminase large subunit-like protein
MPESMTATLTAFPAGAHDDQVDAFVGCLLELIGSSQPVSVIGLPQQSRFK